MNRRLRFKTPLPQDARGLGWIHALTAGRSDFHPTTLEFFPNTPFSGDIGYASIILELKAIAPVTAVLGNTDEALDFNLTATVELGGRKFLVHHIVNPHAPDLKLHARLLRDRPDVVVFGHTHKMF
jgi:hypothetical protein